MQALRVFPMRLGGYALGFKLRICLLAGLALLVEMVLVYGRAAHLLAPYGINIAED